MTLLQEPVYTESCGAELENAISDYMEGNTASEACAYEVVPISKFATTGFAEANPEISAFLEHMMVGTNVVRTLAGYMVENGATPEETALHFLRNWPEVWETWLNEEQIEKVRALISRD